MGITSSMTNGNRIRLIIRRSRLLTGITSSGFETVCADRSPFCSPLLAPSQHRCCAGTCVKTDLIEDIRQETLLRILQIVQREDFQPQHLEAFVIRTARLVSYE